jgi:hypothetical protein
MSHSNTEQKYHNIRKKSMFFLFLICAVALIIRFYHIPYGIPVTLDAFTGYFLYALDISILGHLPNYVVSQSGWSEFLSLIFMNFHSDNFIDYMNLQRTVSVILSALTVIPIYFICRKFFSEYYSLIGAIIFAFEPRIIINSTLGVSEPLYILAISLGILFFLNSNKKIIYSSFGFFACATIIRPEGQFWFIAFSIIYFLRFRKKRKDLIMFLACLAIFLLVLSPIVVHRIQCCENDAIIGRILIEISNYSNNTVESNQNSNEFYGPDWLSGIKLFGWALIPVFIILIPLGLIPILRHINFPNYLLIIITLIISIPILYSTSIAPDTRYVFALFPIFCVISLFGINWIGGKFRSKKLSVGLLVAIIIISSMIFLDMKKLEYESDEEAFSIAKDIIVNVEGVNKGSLVEEYIKQAEIANRWPILSTNGELRDSFEIKRLSIKEYTSLENFIISSNEKGLTHLLIDENHNIPDYFIDVFYNEEKYSYLKNVYDSKDFGHQYHVKLFVINYDEIKKSGLDSKE